MINRSPIYCIVSILVLVCGMFITTEEISNVVRDLTHALRPGIPNFPGDIEFTMDTFLARMKHVVYKTENISTTTHIGTHVDAPSHFAKGTWNIEQIPLDRLLAPAVVIDIRHKTLNDPKAVLTVDDLVKWESEYGRIPYGAVILVLTGWDRYWHLNEKYLGYRADGSRSTPGVSGDAAYWIVQNTKAYGIGIDAISIDNGDNVTAHLILSQYSLYIIENLKNLHKIPPVGVRLFVMPIKIKNASGAPARIIAMHHVH